MVEVHIKLYSLELVTIGFICQYTMKNETQGQVSQLITHKRCAPVTNFIIVEIIITIVGKKCIKKVTRYLIIDLINFAAQWHYSKVKVQNHGPIFRRAFIKLWQSSIVKSILKGF